MNKTYILGMIFILTLLSCSKNENSSQFVRFQTLPTTAYSTTAFDPQPVISTMATDPSQIRLQAYQDQNCFTPATGVLAAAVNPMTTDGNGVAQFSGVNYSQPNTNESDIYIKVTESILSFSTCSSKIRILQKFHNNLGYFMGGTTSFAGGTGNRLADYFNSLTADADGSIYLAGSSRNSSGGYQFLVQKRDAQGNLDTSFGTGGTFLGPSPGIFGATAANVFDTIRSTALAASGKLIIAGQTRNVGNGRQILLGRISTNGTLDTTFASSGWVNINTGIAGATGAGQLDDVREMKIDSVGRILITGTSKDAAGGTHMFVGRFSANGVLDTTFNSTGFYISPTPSFTGATGATAYDAGHGLAVDSSDRVVIIGGSINPSNGKEYAVVYLNEDGSLNTAFSGDGILTGGTVGHAGANGVADVWDAANGVDLDSEGSIVFGGLSKNPAGGFSLLILKYLPNGTLDSSFATNGVFIRATGISGASNATMSDNISKLKYDSKGRVVVIGKTKNTSGGTNYYLMRLNPNGEVDSSFGASGYVVESSPSLAGTPAATLFDALEGLFVDSSDRVMTSGTLKTTAPGYRSFLLRLKEDGSVEN